MPSNNSITAFHPWWSDNRKPVNASQRCENKLN